MTATDMTPKITALLTRAQNLAKERAANWTTSPDVSESFPIDRALEREAILAQIAACDSDERTHGARKESL